MSKKKNTLEDLDEFLKQQAATLVTPDTLIKDESQADVEASVSVAPEEVSNPVEDLKSLPSNEDPAFRKKLYDFIIHSLESQEDSLPEDKMLINTALYLKSGNDWKNVIRSYWKGR